MSVTPIPAIDPISGLIRTLTPTGGALIREWAEAVAATTGNIEYGVSYNVNLNPVTGVWAGRDTADICWLEKWGDTDGKKEIWYAVSANAGVVPAWTIVMTIDSAGSVGIGTAAPTATIHLKAGAAAAGAAPLKFTSGTNLTAPEVGAVEFSTDAFYGTITTGAVRKTFAFLESPSFTAPVLGAASATSITAPLIIGGAAVDSNLNYKSTTGAGTSAGIAHQFTGGNNGATMIAAMLNNGKFGIGTTAPVELLHVYNNSSSLVTSRFENAGSGGERIYIQGNTGDAWIHFGDVSTNWSTGVDNSDSHSFKISGSSTTLGANDRLTITTAGLVGIGTTAPTAVLHLKAGTATANSSPIKLTSGTNLTTPEAGAVEYDGTYFYLTNGSVTRHILVPQGRLSKSIAGGAGDTTLTADEASHTILEVTGAITGNRTVTLPLIERQWTVFNNTTGAFTVTFIGATGTGIVVATGKRAIIYSDTTNIVRVTADV